MAPAFLCALLTMSGHVPNDLADGILGDLLSDLIQGIIELLDSLWWCFVVSGASYIMS